MRTLKERHPTMEMPEALVDWLRTLARADEATPLGRRIRGWLATSLPARNASDSMRPLAARRGPS